MLRYTEEHEWLRQDGDEVVTIESVKAASDITAPLDGQITEVNSAIVENPALVNEDPMEHGWFFKMTLANPSDLDELMDEEAYRAYIA
jgi:glycine cleavage system H protein